MKHFSISYTPTIILIILITIIHGAKSQNLINTSCRNFSNNDPNINYTFCTTSLQAAPAAQCATLRGLGSISIRLARYNITDTRCQIKQLLKNTKLDRFVRQCLNDCFELYSDAIPTIKQAMRYYNEKKYDDANVQISSVMDAATTCEDGFKERRGVVSPLTKRNRDVFQLSAVALSIMRVVQGGGSGGTGDSI